MNGKGAPALLSLLAAAIGLAIYIIVRDQHQWWPLFVAAAVLVIGIVLLLVGGAVMDKHPVLGTVMVSFWIVAPTAVGAAVSAAVIWVGVIAETRLEVLPKAEGDVVTEALSAVIAGVAGIIILTALGDPTSWLWPKNRTIATLGKVFKDRFISNSVPFCAVYEDHVPSDSNNPKREINGWNLIARIRRAHVISKAPRAPATGGAATPPAQTASALEPGPVEPQSAASGAQADGQGCARTLPSNSRRDASHYEPPAADDQQAK
jgi:hypothetical protein